MARAKYLIAFLAICIVSRRGCHNSQRQEDGEGKGGGRGVDSSACTAAGLAGRPGDQMSPSLMACLHVAFAGCLLHLDARHHGSEAGWLLLL